MAKLLPLLLALAATGCATMWYGGGKRAYRKIDLVSDPPGAEVAMDDLPVGTAPLTVSIKRHDRYVFTFRWPDGTATCRLEPAFRPQWLFLDILAGGLLLGPTIDAITGNWKTIDDHRCVARRVTSQGRPMGQLGGAP